MCNQKQIPKFDRSSTLSLDERANNIHPNIINVRKTFLHI